MRHLQIYVVAHLYWFGLNKMKQKQASKCLVCSVWCSFLLDFGAEFHLFCQIHQPLHITALFLLSLAIMFSVQFLLLLLYICVFMLCICVFLLYICVSVCVKFDGTNQCSRKTLDICVYFYSCVVFLLFCR